MCTCSWRRSLLSFPCLGSITNSRGRTSTLRSKLTLVTDFTFHRVALFLRYQRFAIRVLSPCYIGSLSRVHKTWSFSSRRPPSIHGNGGGGGGTARTQGVCNTSVKLVDTRITDRTLHSDGNREKLPSVSFARWWNTASGLLRYLVGNCLFPCLQQDLFWPTFVRTNYILGHIILRLIFQASMTRLFDPSIMRVSIICPSRIEIKFLYSWMELELFDSRGREEGRRMENISFFSFFL